MTAPTIDIAGDRLSVHFADFSAASYPLFLKVKALPEYNLEYVPESETYRITAPARFAPLLGFAGSTARRSGEKLSSFLFDDQQAITRMALDAKRFAYWGDCGLGKTLVGLETARLVSNATGGRVLIFTLKNIVPSWLEEAQQFYGDSLPIRRIKSRAEMKLFAEGGLSDGTSIGITNYEKMNYAEDGEQTVNELRHLAGVVLDESDRLKGGGGKQKWALIKSCRGVEYKLSLTATPAPNDTIEFASQASFLEKIKTDADIIWTFFQRNEKTHRWDVKRHARAAFFEFMASWSIYVRDPRRYGWRQGFADVPAPEIIEHRLPITAEQQRWAQRLTEAPDGQRSLIDRDDRNAIQRGRLAQVARGFMYHRNGKRGPSGQNYARIESLKPQFVADLVRKEVKAGRQTIVWTVFDAESDLICEQLSAMGVDHDELHGKTNTADRVTVRNRFLKGDSPCLVTKPSLLGYGQNFQCCRAMVFSGFNDSYVQYYQAMRRAVRYGQKHRVRVHLPLVPELEYDMLENLLVKQAKHEAAIAEMETNYIRARARFNGAA